MLAKVVGELLNGFNAGILGPAHPLPFLDREVRDARFIGDEAKRLIGLPQLAQNEVEKGLVHSRNLAIYDYDGKPQMASHSRYAEKMRREEQQNARAILAENVKKLIARAGSQPALVRLLKVPQKTISRAKNDENAANLDTINDIAHGYGLHPWQLLVPNLDPDNPPMLAPASKEEAPAKPVDLRAPIADALRPNRQSPTPAQQSLKPKVPGADLRRRRRENRAGTRVKRDGS